MKLQSTMRRLNIECYAQILVAFQERPMSLQTILDLTGLHRRTVTPLLRSWYKHGLVHVGEWLPDSLGRRVVPEFVWGAGTDALRDSPEALLEAKARRRALDRARHRRNKQAAGTVFASMVDALAPSK
jgi:hypothetical protein